MGLSLSIPFLKIFFGLCILRIHDIFSACVVWFTFVYRKQEHLAVGSSGIGLTDSRGSHRFGFAVPSPFAILIYHTLWSLSRGFLEFFHRLARLQLWANFQPSRLVGFIPLLTLTIIADSTQITIGKIHKIRKFYAPMFVRFVN